MSTGCGSTGVTANLFAEPGSGDPTWDSSSERIEFESDGVRKSGTLIEPVGIYGTRSRFASRTRQGPYTVSGDIVVRPSPRFLGRWLQRMLGGAPTGGTYGLAETVPEFALLADRVAGIFEYRDCKVSSWVLRGSSGGSLLLTISVVGKTEHTDVGSIPTVAFTDDAQEAPYVVTDVSADVDGTTRFFESFELSCDNAIATRFRNSVSATCLQEQDRVVGVGLQLPFNTTNRTDLYDQMKTGVAVTASLVNGNMSTVFSMPACQAPDQTPVVSGRSEIPYDIQLQAKATASADELTVTHDETV